MLYWYLSPLLIAVALWIGYAIGTDDDREEYWRVIRLIVGPPPADPRSLDQLSEDERQLKAFLSDR